MRLQVRYLLALYLGEEGTNCTSLSQHRLQKANLDQAFWAGNSDSPTGARRMKLRGGLPLGVSGLGGGQGVAVKGKGMYAENIPKVCVCLIVFAFYFTIAALTYGFLWLFFFFFIFLVRQEG